MSDDMIGWAAKGYSPLPSASNQAMDAAGDIEAVAGRVGSITTEILRACGRVAAIADGLYGPQPEPNEGGAARPAPSGQLYRLGAFLDGLNDAASLLHKQLDRLDRL